MFEQNWARKNVCVTFTIFSKCAWRRVYKETEDQCTRGRKHILDCKMRNKTFPAVYIRIEDIASSVQRQMVTLIPVHRRQQLTFYTSVQRNKSQFPPLQMTGLGIRSFALRWKSLSSLFKKERCEWFARDSSELHAKRAIHSKNSYFCMFLTVFPLFMAESESPMSLFAHLLFFKEQIERFAPFAHNNRATVSDSLMSLFCSQKTSDSLEKPMSEFPTLTNELGKTNRQEHSFSVVRETPWPSYSYLLICEIRLR